MLFFLISCFSFILLSNSFSLPWANDIRLLSLWFWKELPCSLELWLKKNKQISSLSNISARMSFKKRSLSSKVENVEEMDEMSILDLPDLALENILGMLPPSSLCNMAGVCSSLRDMCRSDHLWERHMKEKWGKVIDKAAYREWQWHLATKKDNTFNQSTHKGFVRTLSSVWPISWMRSKFENRSKPTSPLPVDSIKSWYLSFESGKFWFPAQVYNREHGHVGFMLSCYDAELSYDRRADTFHARYPPHGRRTIVIEEGVGWDRLRAPPVDTPPHDLHISDCLNDLHPGDHIEIQWRRNKEFPYGWWYGVVGHLESCDGNENYCRCHSSDTVMLDFNQYTPGSRWRQTIINRKDHREEGNETDGFYGGIRKIYSMEEIAMWKRLWPKEVLE
ncbi:hypothetical protein AQUCO_00900399v1 [Aquilegia coerulea]|uniref:F-box domain-containing protein n=1 Tax=Aquilegia coerulea TaxID=218851 RepID=A0A2G5EDE8_AQUCA|nr:hypothetical protein AQUCO_00900399v1 [Aquilegia coerulea]